VPGVDEFIAANNEVGIPTNGDLNSGNPVGVSLPQFNSGGGERHYAPTAFLSPSFRAAHDNLTIITGIEARKIVFDNGRAIAVETVSDGTSYTFKSNKEIILTAGSFCSPALLMRSGVGPKAELEKFGIPVVADLPAVGKGMLDHSIVTLEYELRPASAVAREPDHPTLMGTPELLAAAEAQYALDKTGPLATHGASGAVSFPKIPELLESEEFRQLDPETQAYLQQPTQPHGEIWLVSGQIFTPPAKLRSDRRYQSWELLFQNNLSEGYVGLGPEEQDFGIVVDPKLLSHPFDKRIAIETVRQGLRIAASETYKAVIERIVLGPGDVEDPAEALRLSDEIILDWVRKNLTQGYHSLGTCKMGREDDEKAVVGTDFKVKGVEGVRIADLSVCPVLTANHTQINAYLIGEMAARRFEMELA
jgi:choline dehydrogenase-like flavoprotein